jgi:DNA-binding transcriptional LysR family regulator
MNENPLNPHGTMQEWMVWMGLAWDDVQLFLAIAETGSLSAASKRLKVGQPTVSRRLAEMEYRLGAQLFQRRVSGAVLTSAGERLMEPARHMAGWAAEVERAAEFMGSAPGPRGLIRVTAPPSFAFDFLAPLAREVRERYPELRLEVLSSVERLDLARGEADLALRVESTPSKELVVLGGVTFATAVMVAKSYAARLPRKPQLGELDWIAWAPPFEDVVPNPQLRSLIPHFRPAFTSDNYLVQLRACEAGLGAMPLGRAWHRFSLFSSLVPLDVDLGPYRQSTLQLLCAKSALAVPRVRAVADLILAEFPRPSRA